MTTCSLLLAACLGCALIPETFHRPTHHNPFPQIKRVAVLPFFNQSSEPTVDGEAVAEAYYAELQSIPGFEVLPVGVTRNLYLQYAQTQGEPRSGEDFQQLAQMMGVEAVVVGSVTDFTPYYPPRMALTTNWYAANPGFHPIPPGYGLPWGTKMEKQIPRRIVREAEFELARQQLATQTPPPADQQRGDSSAADPPGGVSESGDGEQIGWDAGLVQADHVEPSDELVSHHGTRVDLAADGLPAEWPSPLGLIPDAPAATTPPLRPQSEPILAHTRIFRGDDAYFTQRLANHVDTNDDARRGGWQNYLRRSNDFIRFCCHLHIAEMLESRGGTDQSDLILRWPISRY